MTSFKAEGASLRAFEVSPPGWYWYWAWLPVFQGSESGALLTGFSEEAEVGLREKCQPAMPKAPDMMARRIWGEKFRTLVYVFFCSYSFGVWYAKGQRREDEKERYAFSCPFWSSQSFSLFLFLSLWRKGKGKKSPNADGKRWVGIYSYVEFGILASALLESLLCGFTAGLAGGVVETGIDARGTERARGRGAERAGGAESGASDDGGHCEGLVSKGWEW
jgi:hypothetical protein